VLEVDYDATDENIKLNYRRLALVGNLPFFFIVAPTILSQIFKLKILFYKFDLLCTHDSLHLAEMASWQARRWQCCYCKISRDKWSLQW